MSPYFRYIVAIAALCLSCNAETDPDSIEKWKQEILQTEQAFSDMAQKEGISQAFLTYAAEDAVLMRNNDLVIGKEAIRQRFENNPPSGGTLTWTPEFVDVAASGDLGYTYGYYVFSATDTSGQTSESTGVFHTVWKRQADGTWRFVWD